MTFLPVDKQLTQTFQRGKMQKASQHIMQDLSCKP